MSLKIDRVELEIVIKNDSSRKQLRKLEDDMRAVRKELKKLPEGTEEWIKKSNELKRLQTQYDQIYSKIGLTGLSIKELQKRQSELNAIIKNLPGNSPLLERYRKQSEEVTARIRELRGQADRTGSSLGRMGTGFNKFLGLAGVAIGSVTGLALAFKKLATDVAHMDDVYSDVMKTTGLSRDEVVGLNDDLKKMDTRTSRESLNMLARDAGKLGIEGKKNILDFVDAGNQINVALGEDLGEDAIQQIGKMVGVYQDATKELQDADLKQQMLAVGSAINELGASSTANEGYLVNFAGRLGGISRQAGISINDILGFGAALDQDMQQVEMAGTAFSNFIQKLMGDPAKFARLAGLEVNAFTDLLNTDTNAAIKQVLRSMNEKGGFQALIPLFEDMGLEGSRAVGVLSSMAGSIEKIDKAQQIASASLKEGTSITEEYAIKNNNGAAKLEKSKKVLQEVSLKLGEELNPLWLQATNLVIMFFSGLSNLIPLLPAVGKALVVLTGYWLAYNGKLIASNILMKEGIGLQVKQNLQRLKDIVTQKAQVVTLTIHNATVTKTTIATKAAAAAQTLWNMAMKANPLGLAIAALSTLIGLIWIFSKKRKEEVLEQAKLLDVEKKANDSYDTQAAKIKSLTTILNNEKISLQERKKALNELKEIVPGYHAELTQEGTLIKNNTDALKNYLVEFSKKTRLEAAKDKLVELNKQLLDAEREYDEYQARYNKENPQTDITLGDTTYSVDMNQEKGIGTGLDLMLNMAKDKVTSIKKDIGEVEKMVEKAVGSGGTGSSGGTGGTGGGTGGNGGNGGSENQTEKQKVQDALKQIEVDNLNSLKAIKEEYLRGSIASEADYNQRLLDQQDAFERARKQKMEDLLLTITDPALKTDLLSQVAEIDKKLLDRQIEQNLKIKQIIQDADPVKAEEKNYEKRLRETGLFGVKREDLTADQLAALEILEKEHSDKLKKLSTREAAIALDSLEKAQEKEEASLAQKRTDGLLDEEAYNDAMLTLELDFLKQKLTIHGLSADQIETITKQIQDKQTATAIKGAKDRQSVLEKYGLGELVTTKETELAILKDYEDKGTLTHEEAEKVRDEITKKYLKKRADDTKEMFNEVGAITATSLETTANFQAAEEQAVTTKYQRLLDAAEANGRDSAAIEEQREKELSKIRAKYADKQFILTVANVIASTAVSAMNAYESASEVPFVGYILGPIAAAAAVTYGASQIAVARRQQQAAKAGYRIGGFTDPDPDDDKEVGPVHANEFVTRAEGVRNPAVRQFLDVFDVAQKNGTIHLINTTQILEKTKLSGGARRSGGYTSDVTETAGRFSGHGQPENTQADDITKLLEKNAVMLDRLYLRLNEPLKAESVISGSSGSYEQTKKYERMIKNASRK